MHQDLTLIATFTMALLMAFIGGYAARKLGLPALVGYLFAGLIIGPFTPGFVGDLDAASQLAEMGVIFMLFGVGLHFSLRDLWEVRRVAIPGAMMQTLLSTLIGFGLTQLWGWSIEASLVLGLAISVASTVVLLRGLSDNGLLNTVHGKVAVGWLIFEDLATVAILVLLPALVSESGSVVESLIVALVKTAIFVAIMLFVGARVMPMLLTRIASTRSRELFILAVVALALGTAFAAYELFGVSLALGAFLAGVVIGESDISHQVGAEVIPFRDIFTVLFFVSVGMLVNPAALVSNAAQVIEISLLIIVGKGLITILLGLLLPASARTMIVVAAGLSQIGEFSFIVGQTGVALGMLTQEQYTLILAGALISIIINPVMFRLIPHIERLVAHMPVFSRRMEKGAPQAAYPYEPRIYDAVIVGYGRVGKQVGRVLEMLDLSYLVVEQDPVFAAELEKEGINTLIGDAANSEILLHSGLENAKTLVVTVPKQTDAEMIVAAGHSVALDLPIIARASTESGVERLIELGARHVIHPELEGGLEIVRHTLLTLNYPMGQIQSYVDNIRQDAYEGLMPGDKGYPVVDQLLKAIRGIDIVWEPVPHDSPVVGQSLAEANIRSKSGASVIALVRGDEVIPNPKSFVRFEAGDLLGLIGDTAELADAERILNPDGTPRPDLTTGSAAGTAHQIDPTAPQPA